jgi:hypothetical protein
MAMSDQGMQGDSQEEEIYVNAVPRRIRLYSTRELQSPDFAPDANSERRLDKAWKQHDHKTKKTLTTSYLSMTTRNTS